MRVDGRGGVLPRADQRKRSRAVLGRAPAQSIQPLMHARQRGNGPRLDGKYYKYRGVLINVTIFFFQILYFIVTRNFRRRKGVQNVKAKK